MWGALFAFHICIAELLPELLRRAVVQRAVGTLAVVILAPGCQSTPDIVQRPEPGCVEALDYGRNIPQTWGMQNVNLPSVAGTSGLTNIYPIGHSNVGDVIYLPAFTKYNNYLANASATYIRGNHSIRFGGAVAKREYDLFSNAYPVGLEVFSAIVAPPYFNYPNAMFALLAGAPAAAVRANQLNALIYEYWEPSGFLQDDWHATQHLTLNLGLRYEVFPPNTERRNRTANFNLSTFSLELATTDPHLGVATGYGDFQPRIGFALELPHQAAVHGGLGMSFYPIGYGTPVGSGNPPSFYSGGLQFPSATIGSLPVPSAPSPATLASNTTITNVNSWQPKFGPQYIEQFSLEAQKQFGNNVVTIGYVGELGRKMP
jgi:TonB dependent receptor